MKRNPRSSVLIIAPVSDPHACVVAKRVEALEANAVILDSAEFPSRWELSVRSANDESPRFTLRCGEVELDENDIAGVWWRRPQRHLSSHEVKEPHLRRFVTTESQAAFEGWLHGLGDRVINPIAADRAASHKLLQLQRAVEVGLRIPKTLATNSPDHAQQFFDELGGATVYKPFGPVDWQLVPTQRLSVDALAHIEAVAYAPVIFQEEIVKVADIRVNILDGQVFTVLIPSGRENAPIDWRIDPVREYVAHELPGSVHSSLQALMLKLGLRFAACDLALTKDGDYVFFEANTGGQWLFAEIMVHQEISWAFAKALLRADKCKHSL